MGILFHTEDAAFNIKDEHGIILWINKVIDYYEFKTGDINIIFTSNQYLLQINRKYLKHSYFTDVITFNYNQKKIISGDIFVSIDQVEINSKEFGTIFDTEIKRVIIHGVLHLIGYDDKSDLERAAMQEQENVALRMIEDLGDE